MLFTAMFLFFIILNGRITWEILLVGAVLCAAADLLACRTLGWNREKSRRTLRLLPDILRYAGLMLWEILKANIAVIHVILDPKMRELNPQLIPFRSGLRSDFARTVLSDSITITPGTYTVCTDGEELMVHCLGDSFRPDNGEVNFHQELLKLEKKEAARND